MYIIIKKGFVMGRIILGRGRYISEREREAVAKRKQYLRRIENERLSKAKTFNSKRDKIFREAKRSISNSIHSKSNCNDDAVKVPRYSSKFCLCGEPLHTNDYFPNLGRHCIVCGYTDYKFNEASSNIDDSDFRDTNWYEA
jgi:hypothetical protein